MFGRRNEPPIRSLIGATTHVKGNVEFEQTLRVDGTVEGNIVSDPSLPSMLVVSERGKVTGQVNANRVVLNGEIHGPVFARELLELQPNARVFGDLHYNALEMHPGAVVQGRLCHERAAGGVSSVLHSTNARRGHEPSVGSAVVRNPAGMKVAESK